MNGASAFRACLLIALAVVCAPSCAAAAPCKEEIKPIIKDLNRQIGVIRKQWNKTLGQGPKVELGSCTKRLHRLDGPYYLCCKDYSNWAPMIEAMACLELKKFYLSRACACNSRGGYSFDTALQDEAMEIHASIKHLQSLATKRGIRNPLIRNYVSEAQKALYCLQTGSLATLRSIERSLSQTIPGP